MMQNYLRITIILAVAAIMLRIGTDSSATTDSAFSFVVIANPQTFHLKTGSPEALHFETRIGHDDKVKNFKPWAENIIGLIKATTSFSGIDFGIINGDLTEDGSEEDWFVIQKPFELNKDQKFPFFFGLGNRDYQDNVGKCTYTFYSGKDGCAIQSVKYMEERLEVYTASSEKLLHNYRNDLPFAEIRMGAIASFAYSWDYKQVHFVQLQNYPTYQVKLMNGELVRYTIISSLTWLADDLRMARHRGVIDIILNFHQYEGGFKESPEVERRHFQSIMQTYKPLAVFTANEKVFTKHLHNNHSFYFNTTVYETSAAYDGNFHKVSYSYVNNTVLLTVQEYTTATGFPTKLQEHSEPRKPLTPVCKLPKNPGFEGDIYATEFIPKGLEWNLISISQPTNAAEIRDFGDDLMVKSWNKSDSYQAWGFEKLNGNEEPEYSSWYRIKHLATNTVLESSSGGRVFTTPADSARYLATRAAEGSLNKQHWRPIKISAVEILLVNRGTNYLLSLDGSKLRGVAGYETSNKAKIWQLKHYINQTTLNNVRYFKAKTNDSWKNPFPEGSQSDSYWQFLSDHDYLSVSPCIGW